ncbi:MAG: Lrp/AsnC family transcriptional regulator [Pikeienuella sp.]
MKDAPDATDRRIMAALRADGRASISALAAGLGLARGTVRARIEALLASGAIRRFTIETGADPDPGAVRAVMSIALTGSMSRQVIRALEVMPEITALHTTNGEWDLVAEIRAASLPAFDRVLREVRAIPGVSNSQTSLLLDTIRG